MREFTTEEYMGIIAFFCIITAIANIYILRSQQLWLCIAAFAAIVVLYMLMKIVRLRAKARNRRAGASSQEQQQGDKVKHAIVEGSASLQQQTSQRKDPSFKLPAVAGYAPQQLQEPTTKKARQKNSPAQDYVPSGLPPELFLH
jgi:hypothetical protein